MNGILETLILRLEEPSLLVAEVIPWSSPIPVFGNLETAKIATLGINPSNREFVDSSGSELQGKLRRFHTLHSLRLSQWSDAKRQHINLISDSCIEYFTRNPYDTWFRRLDAVLSDTMTSYYHSLSPACHLDLVPYATKCKWSELTYPQRRVLLSSAADTLGKILRSSAVQLLVLNGSAVVRTFVSITNLELKKIEMGDWALPRRSGPYAPGFAYYGVTSTVGHVKLTQKLHVAGFNHNIQSSFGVTRTVSAAISRWIGSVAKQVL